MQATMATKDLLSAVRSAARIIPAARVRGPLLDQCVRLIAGDRSVTVQGARPGLHVEVRRPAAVAKQDMAAVNARALVALLAALDAPEITLTAEGPQPGGKLRIDAGAGVYRLDLHDSGAFPAPPHINPGPAPSIPAAQFLAMLRATAWAIADDAKPVICGLHVEIAKQAAIVVATNGYVCSVAEERLPFAGSAKASGILPRAAVLEALRAVKPGGVTLRIGAEHFRLTAGDWTISGDTIPGAFPNWRAVIANVEGYAQPEPVTVSRAALQSAAKRAGALGSTSSGGPCVTLTADRERLAIVGDGRHGTSEDEIPAACGYYDPEPVRLDLPRLAPCLAALRSRDVAIELRGATVGAIFRDTERPGCFVLVTPTGKGEG